VVGLVIITHSKALSRALVNLIRQVSTRDIPVSGVGGAGADKKAFGTDAVDIVEAVKSVYSSDGVLVLMDLGSAILSAETAMELLSEEMRSNVRLCAAPIVEGAIAAGVQISLGCDLETACQEASRALAPKIQHLRGSDEKQTEPPAPGRDRPQPQDRREIILAINTLHGLHLRPAARLVQTAAAFDARIRVKKLGSPKNPVSATSLNGLATLDVKHGDRIAVSASGPDAQRALKALTALVDEEFKTFAEEITPAPEAAAVVGHGAQDVGAVAVSDGIALGPIFHYQAPAPKVSRHRAANPDREWKDLLRARDHTCRAIQQRRQKMDSGLDKIRAEIFEAHLLIAKDPVLLDRARRRIFEKKQNAASAWQLSVQEVAAAYRELSDDYRQQRAADVLDVGNQVLFSLLGQSIDAVADMPQPAIVVAQELTPTDTAMLDTKRVLGIVTVSGGPTSHSAILARSLDIPAIAGVNPSVLNLPENTVLALDGFSGTLWIRPSPEIAADLKKRRLSWLQRRNELRKSGHGPAVTRDGRPIIVAANLGNVFEAGKASENGADGVGLLRTEFLYLRRNQPPSEAEQIQNLRQIGETIGAKPICVRTLDVGGDKSIPYLPLKAESNPYLGLRAVRLCMRYPEIFRRQLRAVLRAGTEFDFRLMFPMITRTEEVDWILETLDAVHRELAAENVIHRWPIQTGIMIETPAAALLISSLVQRLDFFSVGTNDLTQYTLAAERGNADLAAYADALHPVILNLIRKIVDEVHRHKKPISVCGELAADPPAVPVLVGLGVDELSLSPDAVPKVKAIIRKLEYKTAVELAAEVLSTDNAGSARNLASAFFNAKVGCAEQRGANI
jgi:phosphoenolpyruvate-protein phosphotransferase/dihydroxyacetone kinase phosphotransfer subunit